MKLSLEEFKKQIRGNTKKIAINHYLNNNITQNEIAKNIVYN